MEWIIKECVETAGCELEVSAAFIGEDVLICLKGGELEKEILPVKHQTVISDLKDFFSEEFFETKKVVYVTINR